jgi:Domain of unknown function (DUF5916)/Carbohydrate family 9 binding domain-like
LRSTLLLFAAISLAFSDTPAQTNSDGSNQTKYQMKAVRIHGDVDLTGKLTDPHWKLASKATLNYEIQPGQNTPAPQKTDVMVLYNSRYLYIGFNCHDTEASQIRAHVSDRDNAFSDDFVGIILDTYGDHQRGYEAFVNPFGDQMDGLRNGNNEDMSFDMIWYSKASISDSGYTAEMAIPFKSLRFPTKDVQDWGMEFIRIIPRESRTQVSWVPIDFNNPCLLCQLGRLDGLKGLQSTGSIDLLPYIMGLESGSINDDANPRSGFTNGPVTGRAGLSMKYSPNPSVSLEGVVNPDFSQVESDAAQISVNNPFALFYSEKRPFFMDGSDIFSTPIQTYYSRTINNPLAAAKIVDKSGPFSVAYLGAEDRNSPFIIAGEEGSVADNNGDNTFSTSYKSFSNILRARYNFGQQSFVGGIVTTRNFTDAHNYVGGVDCSLLFGGSYTFDGQFLMSNTRELNDTNLVPDPSFFGNTRFTKAFDGQEYDGTGFKAEFRRDARVYSFKLTYSDFSPTFQAEDGYVFSNDLRTATMDHSLEFYPNTQLVDNWGLDVLSGLHFDYQGSRKEAFVLPDIFLNLKSQTQINATYLLVNDELYNSVKFVGVNRWLINLYSNPVSMITFSLNAAIGRFIYRSDQPALGRGHDISAELVVKPTDRLSLTLDYSRSRLSNVVGGELLFDGYIARLAGIYQFSNRVFVRLIGQYDQFHKQIEIDPLFSYKLNPFTIFYAGSTHSMEKFGEPYGIVQTGRQFFIKLQYLWRS